jgi:hypothetical protein
MVKCFVAQSLPTGVKAREGNFNIMVQAVTAGKAIAVPVQVLINPQGSRRLRLPDFQTVGT